MGILDLFSKRKAREARGGQPDVYQYDELPRGFRVQVVHIWMRAIGSYQPYSHTGQVERPLWLQIEQAIAEEHSLFRLGDEIEAVDRCANYFLDRTDTFKALDVLEVTFGKIDRVIRPRAHMVLGASIQQHPDDAIEDLNARFREHGIGYQYAGGQIIRIDSQYVHAEAVKPALSLLGTKGFEGPQQEFLGAHAHYRAGRRKEAINDALKALESTLKVICDQRKWPYNKTKDTAKTLLDIVLQKGLLPEFLGGGLGGLRSALEALVPTTRNRTSGHGQGAEPREVPDHLAAYVLHVTASTIVLLAEAHARQP